jgi:electron transfer flavoprotein alpha subunit
VVCPGACPQMATVESGVTKIQKDTRKDRAPCEFIQVNPETYLAGGVSRIKVLRFIKADPKKIDISDADLIVCGGKGGGNKAQFEKIEKLADLMGAALGGSRVAVDNGCIDRERQIGQSGRSVSPELIISCGVSGAHAHTFGMKDAKTVIAINKDKNAPIIKLADLGVVGDLHEILPRLNERLKKYLDQINPEKR